MAELITLLVYALATARGVQLVADDKITEWFRVWFLRRAPKGSLRRYWIGCDWCLSIALALFGAGAVVWGPRHPVPWFVAVTLALSWTAVWLRAYLKLLNAQALMLLVQTPTKGEDEQEEAPNQ